MSGRGRGRGVASSDFSLLQNILSSSSPSIGSAVALKPNVALQQYCDELNSAIEHKFIARTQTLITDNDAGKQTCLVCQESVFFISFACPFSTLLLSRSLAFSGFQVKRSDQVCQCSHCFHPFHLLCLRAWARSSLQSQRAARARLQLDQGPTLVELRGGRGGSHASASASSTSAGSVSNDKSLEPKWSWHVAFFVFKH